MSDLDLSRLTIARAAKALRARELSPLELTESYLRRIERLNPRINAYITVTAERARADARRATEDFAAGRVRGPLHGIPVALKDLFETEGIRTTGGAKIHADYVPTQDCPVAERLRDAGTILLGKLNTHEYAYGVTTNNPHFGPTRNPWNLAHIPGGSSGGSGAAIAAGLATATTGTDTGGSIRMPASVCGVVGLKPTYGRVSKAGVLPLSYLFDHAGPITRTVGDAALVLNAIAGYDPADPTTVRTPVDDYTRELGAGLRGVRVGVPRGYFFDRLEDEVGAAVEHAIAELRRLGADVRDVEIRGIEAGFGAIFGLVLAEAQEIHAHSLRTRPADFGADVLELLSPPAPDARTLMLGLRARDALSVSMRTALESVDVLVTPTTPIVAARIGQENVRYGGVEESVFGAMIRCTGPFNTTGLPALSLPCGFTRAGLPVGLQIVGRPFEEVTVLRAGHAYEQATEWHERVPAL
ncbi:MAG TPA: amidase [Myxococcota bacterium]|nr:amidase [Myxococcota bacterium]